MSTIPFDRYEEEFSELSNQIQTTVVKLRSTNPPSSTDMNLANNLVSQCKDLLKQMTIEARGADNDAMKQEHLHKVRVCKANFDNLQQDVKEIQQEMDRSALLSNGSTQNKNSKKSSSLSNDAKERLLQTNSTLSSQNSTLENARRVMADTEQVALEITDELARNRETIQSAHGRVRNVSGLTNQARRILISMQRREIQQKMVVYGVGIGLVVAVLFMLGVFG